MKTRSHAASSCEILVASPLWKTKRGATTILRRAVSAASAACRAKGELTIVLTDDAAIRRLNHAWRGLDESTNVLSFPARKNPRGGLVLGDIVIAYETTAREAVAETKPFRHHLSHLAVHGFLHLMGYDHTSNDQAEAMERLERAILARLDVPDPYEQGETRS